MTTKTLPKYLIRMQDLSVFSLNPNGYSYSSQWVKENKPDIVANEWSHITLRERGFTFFDEEGFNQLKTTELWKKRLELLKKTGKE